MDSLPRPQLQRAPLPASLGARAILLSGLVLLGAIIFQYGPRVLGLGDDGLTLWANAWWIVTPGVAACLSFMAAVRSEGDDRAAWRQFGLGWAAWSAGTLIWVLTAMTYPGPADIAYLATCLFMIHGMFLFCRVRELTRIQIGNFVLALSAVAIALLVLLLPYLQTSVLGLTGTAVAFAYPFFWFGTTAFGIMCLVSDIPAGKRPILWLLIVGSLTMALANLFYGLFLMGSPYRIGAIFDSGWIVGFLLFTWAANDWRTGAASEALRRLRARQSSARSPLDALVPAAALALILAAVAAFGVIQAGAIFALFIPPALFFVVFLGLRGRWMAQMERRTQDEIRRRMEEANAASHAKSTFLATMSHEIRTPMSGVLGIAEELSLTEMSPDQKSMVRELRASGSALLTIISDVLDFSKVEAGKTVVENRPTDLRAALKALEPIFRSEAEARQVEFSVSVDETLSSCHLTDAGRIRQILTNFIGNALKFTEQGSVRLEVRCSPAQDDQQAITFSVTDSGIGIAAKDLARIFDPFEQADATTTRRFGGTGLGLAISKRLAEALGGDIKVASTVGQGSTFTLSLSLEVVPARLAIEADTTEVSLPNVVGARVLVADDNQVNRFLLSRILSNAGCIATVVETGTAAVQFTERQDFDFVFMDIAMPEMDGYQATRTIREREARNAKPMLPIMGLTAHAGESHREECLRSGMQGMLSKPFRRADILQAIAAHAKTRLPPAQDAFLSA